MEPALWATRYAMREPALQVLESEYLFERPSADHCFLVRECRHATKYPSSDSHDCIPACKWFAPIAPRRAGEVEGDLVADGSDEGGHTCEEPDGGNLTLTQTSEAAVAVGKQRQARI